MPDIYGMVQECVGCDNRSIAGTDGGLTMAELKPCPFCGGEAEIGRRRSDYNHWKQDGFIPRCKDTKCMGRSTRVFQTETAAIKAWNRRVNDGKVD